MTRRFVALVFATSFLGDFVFAHQSGIKGVDLPADPIIPIPLYHPRTESICPRERAGLLNPVEITASGGVLKVQAGIVHLSLTQPILVRAPRLMEVLPDGDLIEIRCGDSRYTGRRAALHPPFESMNLKGDGREKQVNELFVGWKDGLTFCFH
jgi:hypothetical protein